MSDYDTDFYAWTQAQAAAIRAGAWQAIDREPLAEEIEDVGKRERRAVISHLRVLLTHLLKWEYQPDRRSESWLHSMGNAQVELQTILDESPSLRPEFDHFVGYAYQQARHLAARETGRPLSVMPDACSWDPRRLLDPAYLPEKWG